MTDKGISPYARLHDFVSDMIEGGRLRHTDIPEDYDAIVQALQDCAADAPDGDVISQQSARALLGAAKKVQLIYGSPDTAVWVVLDRAIAACEKGEEEP